MGQVLVFEWKPSSSVCNQEVRRKLELGFFKVRPMYMNPSASNTCKRGNSSGEMDYFPWGDEFWDADVPISSKLRFQLAIKLLSP